MAPSAPTSWTRRLWPLAAFQFAFIAGATQLKTAAIALVLSRFESVALPYLYLAGAVLVAVLTAWPRYEPEARSESPTVLTALGAACALVLAAGVSAGMGAAVLALYLLAEVGTTFVSIRFWSRAGAAFDARESRRAFTVLNGLGMGGGMAGGLLMHLLAEPLGTVALLVSGGLMLAAAALLFRFHRGPLPAPRPRHARKPDSPPGTVVGQPYPRMLALVVLVLSVLSAFADYLFRLRAEGTLGEDQLAALFGTLQIWLGLLCVVFQLLVAERLLARLGVLRYLALVPAVLGPLAVAALLTPGLWPAYLLRLVDTAVSYSILPVGMQLLYAALPGDSRDGVRGALDGLVRKLGLAVAALLLILAGRSATASGMAVAVVALCGLVGVLLLRLRPAYLSALGTQVGAALDAEEAGTHEVDLRLLTQALRSDVPERVLRAVSVMEMRGLPLRRHLPALLAHAAPVVRERGVALALELGAREVASTLERFVATGPPSLRVRSAWALGELAPQRAARILPPLLASPELALRCAAIGALLRTRRRADAHEALQELVAHGLEAPAEERCEVAQLLGRLKDERYAPLLARFLSDGDGAVRRAAVVAVGVGGYGQLAARLLGSLTVREERRIAREALIALGDRVTPLLEQSLDDRSLPLGLRLELPRVLCSIGTQAAMETLLFSNARDDARLHIRIGRALSRLREEYPEHPVDETHVRRALARWRDVYHPLVGAFRDLRAGLGDTSLLTRAVGDRLDQALELSFTLLGMLYPPQALRRIHQHLVGEDAHRRAYALELLENLVTEEDRALVMEQVEAHPRLLPPLAPGRVKDHLARLALGEDVVLRACARHVAAEVGLGPFPRKEGDMADATVERMFLLQEVGIFSQADVDDVAALAAVAHELRFAAGERVYSQGDPGDALYVIVKGSVDAVRNGAHVLRMGAGQAFGDVSLLDGAPRPSDIIAVQDTRVLVIDRRDFLDLLADRPELLTGLFRYLSQQLRAVIEQPGKRTGEFLAVG
ncbi:MAG: cyclic nucleotide-binding domain-containing protein [Myxococcaceae bacterium]|nr:cyclic nucleotide-binding domain-containing protein [Myxococcaceae bacterium]